MIELTSYVWFAAGLATGLLHAKMLWQAAHRVTGWTPVSGMLRLGVVAAVLVIASLSKAILVAVVGWAAGLVALSAWFFVRDGRVAASPSRPHDNLGT